MAAMLMFRRSATSLSRRDVCALNGVRHIGFMSNAVKSVNSLFTSRPSASLRSLEHLAKQSPSNPAVQALYVNALLPHDPAAVVKHVRSGQFAINADVMDKYERALTALNRISSDTASARTATSASIGELSDQSHLISSPSNPIPVILVPTPTSPALKRWGVRNVIFGVLSGALLLFSLDELFFSSSSTATDTKKTSPTPAYKRSLGILQPVTPPKNTFEDVVGIDEVRGELNEMVDFLKNPSKYTRLGARVPKGVLLSGAPGTGKTLLARAVAGEARVPFFSVSGSEFEEVYVGVGAKRIRDLFARARKSAPCIVFIDELDAIGGSRKGTDQSSARASLNQLLVELDGFHSNEHTNVVVIAATNTPDVLDPALTRPGRFDRHVKVPLPDRRGREQILQHYAKNIKLAPDADLSLIARGTVGSSGATLYNIINAAAIRASRHKQSAVTLADLEYAKDQLLVGTIRLTAMTDELKRQIAYREGGHALVAMHTAAADPLYKVTLVTRGQQRGQTSHLLSKDEFSRTRAQLIAAIDVAMGGRVAEELVFGANQISSEVANDLEKATRYATAMVKHYGMGQSMGLMAYGNDDTIVSDQLANESAEEISAIMSASYRRAKDIVSTHLSELHDVAAALIQYETLDLQQINDIISRKSQAQIALKEHEHASPARQTLPANCTTQPAPAGKKIDGPLPGERHGVPALLSN